jgi:hypothetical protein
MANPAVYELVLIYFHYTIAVQPSAHHIAKNKESCLILAIPAHIYPKYIYLHL